MAASPKNINIFDNPQRIARILATYAWMSSYNNNANARYRPFNKTGSEATLKPYTGVEAKDVAFEKGVKGSAPTVQDLLELMYFIDQANATNGTMLHGKIKPTKSSFGHYTHEPDNDVLASLNSSESVMALSNEMLDAYRTFTTTDAFASMKENVNKPETTPDDKKRYEYLQALYANILARQGSGQDFKEERDISNTDMVSWPVRFLSVIPFAPITIMASFFLLPILSALKQLFPKQAAQIAYTNPVWGFINGLTYPVGETGREIWVKAGLDSPDKHEWGSPYTLNKFFGYAVVVASALPEALVKALFIIPKILLGYHRWPEDNATRRGFDALEKIFISILAAPLTAISHAFSALIKVIDKTFAPPNKDQGLIDFADYLDKQGIRDKKWLDNPIDSAKPFSTIANVLFIVMYKAGRLLLDTFPAIFAATIVGTLRSIVSAPKIFDEKTLDKVFGALEKGIYGFLFVINALFWGTLITIATGGALPSALAAFFGTGAHGTSVTASQFASGYVSQIGNVIGTVVEGVFTGIDTVVNFLANNINPADFFNSIGEGFKAMDANLSKGAEVGIGVGGAVAGVAGLFGLAAWWEKREDKKAKNEKDMSGEIKPGDSGSKVTHKMGNVGHLFGSGSRSGVKVAPHYDDKPAKPIEMENLAAGTPETLPRKQRRRVC